jgi:hypothetical protein
MGMAVFFGSTRGGRGRVMIEHVCDVRLAGFICRWRQHRLGLWMVTSGAR